MGEALEGVINVADQHRVRVTHIQACACFGNYSIWLTEFNRDNPKQVSKGSRFTPVTAGRRETQIFSANDVQPSYNPINPALQNWTISLETVADTMGGAANTGGTNPRVVSGWIVELEAITAWRYEE